MSVSQGAAIRARLDRLPASAALWRMVLLLSLGGLFEFYDLFFTGYVAPGLIQAHIFKPPAPIDWTSTATILNSIFDFGTLGGFIASTFAGMFIGTMVFGFVADVFGRRVIFTWALLWYSVATATMAFQNDAFGVNLWRFLAGIGVGVELVTIDTYLAELVPLHMRGRAFAVNQAITYCAVPIVAFLAWQLVPTAPFGLDGWRWVVLVGALGAVFVWVLRLGIPESPRWLATHGRLAEAERVTATIEAQVERDIGRTLPPAGAHESEASTGPFWEFFHGVYYKRTMMLIVFSIFQTLGYYGFQNWVPTLLIAKGINVTRSLEYTFIIAVANPIGPLIGALIADRMERKWQIVCAAFGIAAFGLLFSQITETSPLIICGVCLAMAANWMSFAFHTYQAELFPTRMRARAVGFCYSWSRFSAIFGGFLIAFFLREFGVVGVFLFIAGSMGMVMLSIGGFGPRVRGLSLEAISH